MYSITHYSADNKRTSYGPYAEMSEAYAMYNKLENAMCEAGEMLLMFKGAELVSSSKYE